MPNDSGDAENKPFYNISIPDFKIDAPGGITTWMKQVETRFKIAKIIDEESKFDHLVASLPSEITCRVFDLINNPPTTNPYVTLTNKIITEFQPSDNERVKKLLKGLTRGNKKPSLYCREMRES